MILKAIGLSVWQIGKVIASIAGGILLLMWLVGSAYYLVCMISEYLVSGHLTTLSELDQMGPVAVQRELYFFWASLAFWVIVGIVGFVRLVLKNRSYLLNEDEN